VAVHLGDEQDFLDDLTLCGSVKSEPCFYIESDSLDENLTIFRDYLRELLLKQYELNELNLNLYGLLNIKVPLNGNAWMLKEKTINRSDTQDFDKLLV
jgi:hypothetical protein